MLNLQPFHGSSCHSHNKQLVHKFHTNHIRNKSRKSKRTIVIATIPFQDTEAETSHSIRHRRGILDLLSRICEVENGKEIGRRRSTVTGVTEK
jgi:hypothetical protein